MRSVSTTTPMGMRRLALGLLLIPALVLGGCEDYDSLVTDPNQPTQVYPSLLLTNLEADAFEQVSLSAGLAVRYFVYNQGFQGEQYYTWQRSGFGAYDQLRSVEKMMEEARRIGGKNYVALGHFFRALYFSRLTRTLGDIPYTNALKGGEKSNFKPTYDRQEDVYAGLLQELETANEMLDPSNGDITGDVIYDGDIRKWRKLVNSLRLRLLMSLSQRAGDSSIDIVGQFQKIVNNPGRYPIMESIGDNGQLQFHDREGNKYPLFRLLGLRTSYFFAGSFVNMLKEREDPRLFAFAAPDRQSVDEGDPETEFGSYSGLDAGVAPGENVQTVSTGLGSRIDSRYYDDPVNEPSVLLGYWEVAFILAEASERGWIPGDPAPHYQNGIKASMRFYDVSEGTIEDYLQHPKVTYDESKGIEMISNQKHISFFMNSGWQPFFNQRRTGVPTFRVGPATRNGGKVPTRWMYPQSELENNRKNMEAAIERQYGDGTINGIMWSLGG